MEDDPLGVVEARELLRRILREGQVRFTNHALEEMEKDDLLENDCINMLRAAHVREPEWEMGQWRYRAATPRMVVVFAFPRRDRVIVITAWRQR